MSKLANVFEYESPKGKSKKQIKVTINAIENNEFVNAVLDVLLTSCLKNKDFYDLLADEIDSQRYNGNLEKEEKK